MNGNGPDPQAFQRDAKSTLTIVLRHDGSVGVLGPITNKLMCYGMLEMARDAIASFKEPSAIVQPRLIPPDDAGRPRG